MKDVVDLYSDRSDFYSNISRQMWQDWKWQQNNVCGDIEQIKLIFPNITANYIKMLEKWHERSMRMRLTPYVLSLAQSAPENHDVIWRQFLPLFEDLSESEIKQQDEYSSTKENWEEDQEMLTPICQWKYNNRAIVYVLDDCFGYCNFCLRSVTSTCQQERHGGIKFWKETMRQIKRRPEIEEVLISGGDPLMFSNEQVAALLQDVRSISSVKILSLNTRALTHNPFRIDDELCHLFKKYNLNRLAIQVNHSKEITDDFILAVKRLHEITGQTLILSQTVLIKNVNDDEKILRELFMNLYGLGIKPYYLFHCMPNIPCASQQRTSVQKGVELMSKLKRVISNAAMPEYAILHNTGKKMIPLEINGTPEFKYTKNKAGNPVALFKNWKGEWVEYLDGKK